ncbi:MAG: nuclear transport factor 2 family protein, partial [Saprospiraceae bacterium]|nr:nuclear transport factor 2 family protein [Saprospiraceae bacterium]
MLSISQIAKIEAEVEQAATAHLNAKDMDTALSHFTDEVHAISNTTVFSSREELAADVGEYYRILKSVDHASWTDINVHVINDKAATFTAKFNYGFTSMDGEITNLKGVWTALFVLDKEGWK